MSHTRDILPTTHRCLSNTSSPMNNSQQEERPLDIKCLFSTFNLKSLPFDFIITWILPGQSPSNRSKRPEQRSTDSLSNKVRLVPYSGRQDRRAPKSLSLSILAFSTTFWLISIVHTITLLEKFSCVIRQSIRSIFFTIGAICVCVVTAGHSS